MRTRVNTVKTVQNQKGHLKALNIQQLEDQISFCEKDFLACYSICELSKEAQTQKLQFKSKLSQQDQFLAQQCEEDIMYWKNKAAIWEERIERARSRMRAIYRVMAQKELSHEK